VDLNQVQAADLARVVRAQAQGVDQVRGVDQAQGVDQVQVTGPAAPHPDREVGPALARDRAVRLGQAAVIDPRKAS